MKQQILLIFFVAIYIIYFSVASILRYENFYTGRFDLGNMSQAVWNTSQRRIFQVSNSSGPEISSRLAAHADFFLILLTPFYFIWSDPRMLLLILTVILGVGAFFVYGIAKEILNNKTLALTFSIAFLLFPGIQYNNLYDFHAVSLVPTFFLGAFYFLIRNKYAWTLIFLLLAALAKEQVWITTGLFGLYIFFTNKKLFKKIMGLTICLISFFMFYFLIWHVIPANFKGNHFALSYFSEFGNNQNEIIRNVLFSPHKIVKVVFRDNQLNYLKQLFAPLGFLSLMAPLYLVFILPDLLINLLSNNSQLHQIYYQYTSIIIPFIFISAIFGIKNLIKFFPKIPRAFFSFYLIFSTAISCYLLGPLPYSQRPNTDMFLKPLKNKEIINAFLSKIPKDSSVSSTNNLGSHLSHRQKIFNLPYGIGKVDYILLLVNDSFGKDLEKEDKKTLGKLKTNKDYALIFEKDNFIVFKKI